MLSKMKEILKQSGLAVLATSWRDNPHCSLMAYETNEPGDEVYMMSIKSSKKFINICSNPNVCLLIDTRTGSTTDLNGVQALTVTGHHDQPSTEAERSRIMDHLVARHPHLKQLAERPDVAVLVIKILSFQLLDGISSSYYEEVQSF
ncbi:MAG: pyridoxamine 5'-phosphate oxidase family protein [Deltaproteobacteria bacterium]|nr:pyridoxamine 5'-phosphate oxidase family protein [Deltaproteobacteria bacterium]